MPPSSVTRGLRSLGIDCSVGSNFFPPDRQPMRVGDHTFERGLSMLAGNEIVYRLEGRYTRFSAWAGADCETSKQPKPKVRLLVLADGESLFDSGPMGPQDAAKRVEVPVTGVNELRLRVTSEGERGGHADWAEASVAGFVPQAPVRRTPEFRVRGRKLTACLDAEGRICELEIPRQSWKRAVSGLTTLMTCREEGKPELKRTGGGVEIVRRLSHSVRMTERFTPSGDGVSWELQLETQGPAWSTPIETLLSWDSDTHDLLWAPWGHGLQWSEPLTPLPPHTAWFEYGGFFNRTNGLPIPMLSMLDPVHDLGVTLLQNPEDRLFDLYLVTRQDGQWSFSRRKIRLGEGRKWRFRLALLPHEADPRAALGAVVSRHQRLFEPVNLLADQIAGGAAYASTEDDLEGAKLHQMGLAYNWKASFDFPYMGMFLPPVASRDEYWPRFGGDSGGHVPPDHPERRGKSSLSQLADYSTRMRRQGFYVLNYFNVTEFGATIKEPAPPRQATHDADLWRDANDFLHYAIPKAILRVPAPLYTWGGALVVDCGDPAYRTFLLDQARRHVKQLPDSSGICIDRMDWLNCYNPHADDGLSWHDGAPCRSLYSSWLSLMDDLGPVFHKANKVVFGNTMLRRLDLSRQLDGVYDEHGDFGFSLNLSSFLCLRKPLTTWTRTEDALKPDPDAYFQRYLHMGAFMTIPVPGNDHTILSSPWVDRLYLDYGPLFTALEGRKWVLLPHAVEAHSPARANVFEVPDGYVVPVTFAKSDSVTVTLRHLKLKGWKAQSLVPGETRWKPLAFVSESEATTFSAPTLRGAGLVRLSRH